MSQTNETQVVSTKQTLRLVEAQIANFAGIDSSMNMVMVFPKEGGHIVQMTGDQGVGKTSALNAILSCLGCPEPANAINSKTNTKSAKLVFEKDGAEYTVLNGKGKFTLSMKTATGSSSKMDSPKTELQKLIGNVALNPMDLKPMSGKKQIDWLREVMPMSAEHQKLEAKIVSGRLAVYTERTAVNNATKLLEKDIELSGYFVYDKENKCYISTDALNKDWEIVNSTTTDQELLQQQYQAAEKIKNSYARGIELIENLEAQNAANAEAIEDIDRQIAELVARKAKHQANISETSKRIEDGRLFISANTNANENFEQVKKQLFELNSVLELKRKLDKSAKDYAELESNYATQIRLTATIDEYDAIHKQLIAESLPNIEGFEVVAESVDIDNKDKRPEGLYYMGKTMAMLSESEMFEWYIPLLKSLGVMICVIENMTSFGSKAMKAFNDYANEHGCYIFCSAMEREQDTLRIEFLSELK